MLFHLHPYRLPRYRLSTGALLFFLLFAVAIQVQAGNPAQEARAHRQQLAQKIAAVDATALSTKLVESAGDTHLANWYAGKVLVNNRWLTLEELNQRLAEDKKIMEYRRLRQLESDNLAGHERLARWCLKNDYSDLARVHWLHVLKFDAKHRAALNELGLRWQSGVLLTNEEAELQKQRERENRKEQKRWRVKAKQLKRELEQGQPEQQQLAREQLHDIEEPAAVPALIEEFVEPAPTYEKTTNRRGELLAVLGGINSLDAIETIVSFAVNSSDEAVRYAAIDQLRSKQYEDFVPILLSHMQTPFEASVNINQIGNNIVNNYSYSQETPSGTYESNYQTSQRIPGRPFIAADIYRTRTFRRTHVIPGRHREAYMCGGHMVPARTTPSRVVTTTHTRREYVDTKYGEDPTYQSKRQKAVRYAQEKAEAMNTQLARVNDAIHQGNERLAAVLTEVTGETLDAFPNSWWNWWGDYLDRHPGVANAGARRQFNAALLNREPRGLSQGSLVWTSLGKQPIEKILPGDYVLAQDPRSGELAYKPVLAITNPERRSVSRISLGDSELHCTAGHVVWTAGIGWQRVSKLVVGRLLHGAVRESRVMRVQEAFDIESYDLIVEGFHTCFVGQQGLLVHDATPIVPTYVGLPGFSQAALAHAVQLAANNP